MLVWLTRMIGSCSAEVWQSNVIECNQTASEKLSPDDHACQPDKWGK